MERNVPVWAVVLLTIAMLGFSIWMSSAALKTARLMDESTAAGRAALLVASFPEFATNTIRDVLRRTDEDLAYRDLRGDLPDVYDAALYAPVENRAGAAVPDLVLRRGDGAAAPGWRMLVGTFGVAGELDHAAVLLDEDMAVRAHWRLYEPEHVEPAPDRKDRKTPHGFALLDDGSFLVLFSNTVTVQRYHPCRGRDWVQSGIFHHSAVPVPGGTDFWVPRVLRHEPRSAPTDEWAESYIVDRRSLADGSLIEVLTMQDLIEANPMTDLLEIRRDHYDFADGSNDRAFIGRWLHDPFHLNDADPLPAAYADAFPGFEAGDLLMSFRSLNLIAVVDPETHEIRWWRAGFVKHQHDPDWLPNGKIRVYDNRTGRDLSRIVDIDPATMEVTTVYDGARDDFYSRIRGNLATLENGNLLISSTHQGRMIEVTETGELVYDLINLDPTEAGASLLITDAVAVPGALGEELAACFDAPEALSLNR